MHQCNQRRFFTPPVTSAGRRESGSTNHRPWAGAMATTLAFLLSLGLVMGSSVAGAEEYKIYTPLVVKGENELEMRGFYKKDNSPAQDGSQQYRLSVGRGITNNWAFEFYDIVSRAPGQSLRSRQLEMENRFQLTPLGKYWANFGLLQGLQIPLESGQPYEFELMPIVEKQVGRALAAANLSFERQFGANRESGTIFSYRVRFEYLLYRPFSPALEFHGEPGPIGRFGAMPTQRQQVGPAFYGVGYFNNGRTFYYSTALLFGLTAASSDVTLAFRFEYEFFN